MKTNKENLCEVDRNKLKYLHDNDIEIRVISKGSNKYEFILFWDGLRITESTIYTLSFVRSVENLRKFFSINNQQVVHNDRLSSILNDIHNASLVFFIAS